METRAGLHGTRLGSDRPGDAAFCSDCRGLVSGTSSLMRPHPYLVRIPGAEGEGVTNYRCLVCRSILSRERAGFITSWR
jgi:hypothetical protein